MKTLPYHVIANEEGGCMYSVPTAQSLELERLKNRAC